MLNDNDLMLIFKDAIMILWLRRKMSIGLENHIFVTYFQMIQKLKKIKPVKMLSLSEGSAVPFTHLFHISRKKPRGRGLHFHGEM